MNAEEKQREYWGKNLRMTGLLLAVWFVVTFGGIFFARELAFDFLGWPFSFWMGAQGALAVYVVVIWYHARYMDRLDREYGVSQDE